MARSSASLTLPQHGCNRHSGTISYAVNGETKYVHACGFNQERCCKNLLKAKEQIRECHGDDVEIHHVSRVMSCRGM